MSRDFQLAWPCPHLTIGEVVSLSPDRRSLQTRQPVAGEGTVRVIVNDDLIIPPGGLSTVAQLFSTQSGAYTLTEGQDSIGIESPTGKFEANLGVINQQRWTAGTIVKTLKKLGLKDTLALAEDVNGHLVFSDTSTIGPSSFIRISGSAAQSLGFGEALKNDNQRSARGRKLYPGWGLVTRPDTITNRYPQFLTRLRSNPVIKVTYSVPVNRCLRCRATYLENDIRFAPDGNPILVDNEDLLQQASLKIILTERGSNPYHTWYGTTIKSRIGSKALGSVAAAISDDIRRALSRFQNLQKSQTEIQTVTPKERLFNVLSVQVLPHEQDPTTFLVDVAVQNASSEPIQLSTVFTVPEVVSILGSNGLFLGLESAGIAPGQASSVFNR